MSYTPPAGNAANFGPSWGSAYSNPAGNAANLEFGGNGYFAASFLRTEFGTPSSHATVTSSATGFLPTAFGTPTVSLTATGAEPATQLGTPSAIYPHKTLAEGFTGTTFGLAGVKGPTQTGVATGTLVTAFGTPFGCVLHLASPASEGVKFSTAYYAFPQTLDASGWAGTSFGTGFAMSVTSGAIGQLVKGLGSEVTVFGTPVAAVKQTATATGFVATALGAPRLTATAHPTGWLATSFGTVNSGVITKAQGWTSTVLGTHAAKFAAIASTVAPTVKFGKPTGKRPGAHIAYGINCQRKFGQPRGFSRHNYAATGFTSTHIGSSLVGRTTYKARHIPPTSRLGDALREGIVC